MVIPRGSTFVLSYYAARDAGIFRKHGIDVEVDARPFAGFMLEDVSSTRKRIDGFNEVVVLINWYLYRNVHLGKRLYTACIT